MYETLSGCRVGLGEGRRRRTMGIVLGGMKSTGWARAGRGLRRRASIFRTSDPNVQLQSVVMGSTHVPQTGGTRASAPWLPPTFG